MAWLMALLFVCHSDAQASTVHGEELPARTGSSGLTTDDFFWAELSRAQQDLMQKKRPYAGLLGSYFTDKNDISVLHGGGFARAVMLDRFDVKAQVMTGIITQKSDDQRPRTRLRRNSFMLGLDDYFLTPEIAVWASALLETFSMRDAGNAPEGSRMDLDRDYIFGGRLGARYIFTGGSEVGLETGRQSIWAEHDRMDARLFNRVTDLSQMHPDLAINKYKAFADLATRTEHRLRAEIGYDDYRDSNSRTWGYAHYQLPFPGSRDRRWAVIRPNIYLERVRKENQAYFSPRSHLTVGIMLHAIHQYERWEVEGEINPQLLWTKDEDKNRSTEAGIHGLLRISLFLTDDLSVGLSGFGYADTDDYWLARGILFVRYVF